MDDKKKNSTKLYLERAAAIAAALMLWQCLAWSLDMPILLASPSAVLQSLWNLLAEPDFFSTIWFSFSHIALGFLLGVLCGTLCAILSAHFPLIEILLWPYMAVIKATPVASFIILCLVWLSSRNLSILICFLIVVPVIYSNLLNGIRSLDPQLAEMARIYEIRPLKRLLAIDLPQLRPFLLSSLEISMGMAWKSGIAAEVIGTPASSIGKMLYTAKIYLATPELLAWSVVIVVISVLFERLILLLLNLFYERLEHIL